MKNPRVRLINVAEWGVQNEEIESEELDLEPNTIVVPGIKRPPRKVKVAMFAYCDPVLAASQNVVVMPLGGDTRRLKARG